MGNSDFEVLQRKSEILKAIAHPVRLAILRGLIKNGPTRVIDMETGVDTCAATVSQHLAKMYYVGILSRKRKQTQIFYSLVDKEGVVDMLKTYLMS